MEANKKVEYNFNRIVRSIELGDVCPYCSNHGLIRGEGSDEVSLCACVQIKEDNKRAKKSGFGKRLEEYTFENYLVEYPWQKDIKSMAMHYLTNYDGKWFGCFGRFGSGKTHIGTAICNMFLRAGKQVKYMSWSDEIALLKSKVADSEEHVKAIEKFSKAEVLFIDDFLKTEEGSFPTAADIQVALEILCERYNNPLSTAD